MSQKNILYVIETKLWTNSEQNVDEWSNFENKFRTSAATGVSRKKVGRALCVAIFKMF